MSEQGLPLVAPLVGWLNRCNGSERIHNFISVNQSIFSSKTEDQINFNYFHQTIPILGVCLGHQTIAQAFGTKIVHARNVMHGKTSLIHHKQNGLFKNIPSPYTVMRYHSLVAQEESLADCFEITAWTEDENGAKDEIMGISHKDLPILGVQFHPESISTEFGYDLLGNFLKL